MIGIVESNKPTGHNLPKLIKYCVKNFKENSIIVSRHSRRIDLNKLLRCKLIFISGYKNVGIRKKVIRIANHCRIPIVYIDNCVFSKKSKSVEIDKRAYSITINHPKLLGIDYVNYIEKDASRWDKILKELYVPIKETKITGDRFTILFHNVHGYSANLESPINQTVKMRKLIYELKTNGLKPGISFHPRHDLEQKKDETLNNELSLNIEEIVSNSRCCIAWHSNALLLASLQGIPTVSLDEANFATPISTRKYNKLIVHPIEKREAWARHLSYSQFLAEEIETGEMLKTIYPYIQTLK